MPVPVQELASTEDYLSVLAGHRQAFAPGERFAYNDGAFVVLALIAERVSGIPFERLVQERVCAPAGMPDTAFLRADEPAGRTALGYLDAHGLRTNVLHLPVVGSGDGGISSTAADIRAFWVALFSGRIVSLDRVGRSPGTSTSASRPERPLLERRQEQRGHDVATEAAGLDADPAVFKAKLDAVQPALARAQLESVRRDKPTVRPPGPGPWHVVARRPRVLRPDHGERVLPDAQLLDPEVDRPVKEGDLALQPKLDREVSLELAPVVTRADNVKRDDADAVQRAADQVAEGGSGPMLVVAAIRGVRNAHHDARYASRRHGLAFAPCPRRKSPS